MKPISARACEALVPARGAPRPRVALLLAALALAGCSVSTVRSKPIPEDETIERHDRGAVKYEHANDSPEISRGVGVAGGVVVLWPRVVPRSEDPAVLELAAKVQARLAALAGKAGKDVDRRPKPERVCPRGTGCTGKSLGAVLAMREGGCAVVAVVGPPGQEPVALVPLAGTVELKSKTVPFRDPPENAVTVSEFANCEKLAKDLDENASLAGDGAVTEALR